MDRPVPVDALLEHASFVRSLARHLLREPADAEDAIQETWRTSLERPPREGGSLRAWLGTVLRNVVRQEARGRGRRRSREARVARPDQVEAVDRTASHREMLRRVADAVDGLPGPLRETILLRYYEGLPPRTIAVRMDAPIDTVKSRLARARARLRRELEDHTPHWRAGLVPLVGLEPAATSALGEALGVLTMSTKWKLGIAACALIGMGAWVLTDRPTPETSAQFADASPGASLENDDHAAPTLRTSGTATEHVRAGASRASAQGTSHHETPDPGDDARPSEADTRGVVRGTVRAPAGVSPRGRATIHHAGTKHTVTIDADGSFRLEGIPQGPHQLQVEVEGLAPRRLRVHVGKEREVAVTVEFGTASIWGIAYDELGRPREGAAVRIATHLVETSEGWRTSAGGTVFRSRMVTGPDGRYSFGDLPAGTYTIVGQLAHDEAHRARDIRSFSITVAEGETRRLDLGERYEDPTWSGVVRYADGSVVTRAGNIFLQSEDGERRMYVNYGKDGRFSQQVPVGRYRMEFVLSIEGAAMQRMQLVQTAQRLEMSEHGSTEDPILPGARLTGRLARTTPAAVLSGARQSIHLTRTEPDRDAPTSIIRRARPAGTYTVPVQADGTFRWVGLRPGTYRVHGHPRALEGTVQLRIEEGQSSASLEVTTAR